LNTLLATSTDKEEVHPAGSIVWRAQRGHVWSSEEIAPGETEDFPYPYCPQRMKPLHDRARENRANPKGIPFLYVATHEETALAEVRPYLGEIVSVAQLRTTKELRFINCTIDDHRHILYFKEPDERERERAVWQDIDRAFSWPVIADDDTADYVPTQVLAETFREGGFDGVGYRSSLGEGHNLAIFDPNAADIINCSVREILEVKFKYRRGGGPSGGEYFVESGDEVIKCPSSNPPKPGKA
jgi:hypothetical protein